MKIDDSQRVEISSSSCFPKEVLQSDEMLLVPVAPRPLRLSQPNSDQEVLRSEELSLRSSFIKAIRMVSVGLAIAVATSQLVAQQPLPNASSKTRQIARGKYLVEGAAPCADCHTARNKQGELMLEKALQGAPILFKPTVPIPGWANRAPNIAGLPGWTDEQAIKFLMTGIAYNDLPASPPMPPFRFNREDAIAIVAYLRTLKPTATDGR